MQNDINMFTVGSSRCEKPVSGTWVYNCTLGGGSRWPNTFKFGKLKLINTLPNDRNYTISSYTMTYEEAHTSCADNNLTLVKWDTMEAFFDVGFLTGTGNLK